MRIHKLPMLTLALVPALTNAGAAHGQAPLKTLSRPEVEYAEPFSRVISVRELSDGRVVVADPQEKSLQIVDMRTGRARSIGREGQGPGEFSFPSALFPARGDTTLLWDVGNRRFLEIRPDGSVIEAFRIEGMDSPMVQVRAVDAQGRGYLEGSAMRMPGAGGGMPEPSDSIPLMRYDPRTKKLDTLAHLNVPRPQTSSAPGAAAGTMSFRMTVAPFSARDGWFVAPDGRVAIVRAADYRVEWIAANGTRRAGQPVQYERLRVTDAEKNAYRKGEPVSAVAGGSQAMTVQSTGPGGGGGIRIGATVSAAGGPPRDGSEPDWPTHLPPFVSTGVRMGPDGNLWVPRYRKAGDNVVTYDLFDSTGKLTSRVALPKGTFLVGFGSGTAYVVRLDEDDLQYLQRYRL